MVKTLALVAVLAMPTVGTAQSNLRIPENAKVYVSAINGFEADLTVALMSTRVPVIIVKDRKAADYELSGRLHEVFPRHDGTTNVKGNAEATLTLTDLHSASVVDAFIVSKETKAELAQACARRIDDRIRRGNPPVLQTPTETVIATEPSSTRMTATTSVLRLRIQGDFNHRADFVDALREEAKAQNVSFDIVEGAGVFDYNVVLVQNGNAAAAIALDANGAVVASSANSGFTVKGSVQASARKVLQQIAALVKGAARQ